MMSEKEIVQSSKQAGENYIYHGKKSNRVQGTTA
jgi:hypothetical protein